MLMVPTCWQIRRNGLLPIFDLIGTTESSEEVVKEAMIKTALTFIEEAKKFEGLPFQANAPQTSKPTTVYLSLIFPNDEKAKSYQEFWKSKY